MHVGWGEVDDDFLSWNPEPSRLQSRYRPQKTFFNGRVCQSYQMYSDPRSDVYFRDHGHGLYADALCAMNVYKHMINI